jgi:hypothetical protein
MSERTLIQVLVGSIVITGAAGLYGIQGEYLSGVPISRRPPATAESYWWNKFQYERNAGKHACSATTGDYTGPIVRVYYGEWMTPNGARDRRWLYVVRVELPADIPAVTRSKLVVGGTMGPATAWTATTGKCPDGRP